MARVSDAPTSWRHMRLLSNACDASQWLNITLRDDFQCIFHPHHNGQAHVSNQRMVEFWQYFFFYPFFFSFQPWKICSPWRKLEKGVWFVKLITFGRLFICIKFFFLFFNPIIWFFYWICPLILCCFRFDPRCFDF